MKPHQSFCLLFIFASLFSCSSIVYTTQWITIKGTISNSDGLPLENVKIEAAEINGKTYHDANFINSTANGYYEYHYATSIGIKTFPYDRMAEGVTQIKIRYSKDGYLLFEKEFLMREDDLLDYYSPGRDSSAADDPAKISFDVVLQRQ